MPPSAPSPKPPLRVAYLVNQYPKVSHTFIRREILALERQGLQVQRFALRGWDERPTDAQDQAEQQQTRYLLQGGARGLPAAVLATAVRQPLRLLKALGCALRLARRADRPWPLHLVYLAEACRLAGWLRQQPVDHLHAHFGTNPAEVALLTQLLGGPRWSFTVHGPEEFDKPQALHLGDKVAAAHAVVAISSYGRSQLWRWVPAAHWPKVQVVHCGLEPDFFAPALTPPPDVPQLVCVGRLCEQKGQLLLVDAVAELVRQGQPIRLVLAGDGEMRPQIEARIQALGLQAQVHITGWIDSPTVQRHLLASRALVLASFAEGLPVVLMEAMALGRPVISTLVAGIPELVRHGEDGWLVPAGDLAALVSALQDCLATPAAELARRGAQAAQRVRQRHQVDTEAAKLRTLFAGT